MGQYCYGEFCWTGNIVNGSMRDLDWAGPRCCDLELDCSMKFTESFLMPAATTVLVTVHTIHEAS